jgi:hypothetical protein
MSYEEGQAIEYKYYKYARPGAGASVNECKHAPLRFKLLFTTKYKIVLYRKDNHPVSLFLLTVISIQVL